MSHEPAWLQPAHDEKHRQDSAPLLGEGEFSLQDPETPDVLASSSSPSQYGSTDKVQKEETKPSSSKGGAKRKTIEVPKGKPTDDSSAITNATNETKSVISQIGSKPHIPAQNPCLWLFHLLQGLAAITSMLLLVSQLLPLFLPSSKVTHPDVLSAILKIYVALICLAFVIVEAELPVPFVRNSTLLNAFWTRGFIYSFIGLVCTTEAYSERVDDLITHSNQRIYIGWAPVFMQVVAWMTFGIGAAYIFLGVCCMRGLRDKMKQKEKDSWKQYREDMRAWRRSQKE